MAEYIKREAVIDLITRRYENPEICTQEINSIPVADVALVVHGRWESVKNPQWPAYSHDKCSLCGWWNTKNALCYDGRKKPGHSLNYCPNCGAKMDGERKDGGDGDAAD